MDSQSVTGFRETCEEAVFEHGSCALTGFLGGLANQDPCSMPAFLFGSHPFRPSVPARHVHIVAAGMPPLGGDPIPIRGGDFGRVWATGLLFHGEGIPLRP